MDIKVLGTVCANCRTTLAPWPRSRDQRDYPIVMAR
jgi:hypothetical protein